MGKLLGNRNRLQICSIDSAQDHKEFLQSSYMYELDHENTFSLCFASLSCSLSLCASDIFFMKYVLDNPSLTFFVKSLSGYGTYGIQQAQSLLHMFY